MNGLLLLAIAAALLLTAYLVYGRYLVKTWGIDPKAKTPAYEKEDGVVNLTILTRSYPLYFHPKRNQNLRI